MKRNDLGSSLSLKLIERFYGAVACLKAVRNDSRSVMLMTNLNVLKYMSTDERQTRRMNYLCSAI
jgi:hypothetical protein